MTERGPKDQALPGLFRQEATKAQSAAAPRAEVNEYCWNANDGSMKLLENASVVEVAADAPHILEWYRNGFYKDVIKNVGADAMIMELMRDRLAYELACVYS